MQILKNLNYLLCLLLMIASIGCTGNVNIKKFGNGEYYIEWGVKVAAGHHTEIADERQKDQTTATFRLHMDSSESE